MTSYSPVLSPVTLYNLAMGDLRVGDVMHLNMGTATIKEIEPVGNDLKVTTEIADFLFVDTYPRWHDVGSPVERAM